jgi:hypothetical protein
MFRKLILVVSCSLLAGMILAPSSRADEWNKRSILTFSEPVEVPGVALQAGTYVFRLADSRSDRDMVQILNKDQTEILATIQAIPEYRTNATSQPVVTFYEGHKNSPEAIAAWFYPGDNYGLEFVQQAPMPNGSRGLLDKTE